jgi:transposase InsO family protein
VRRTQRRTLDPQHLQQAVDLRQQRLYLRHIARLLRAPFSTVARALSRLVLRHIRTRPYTPRTNGKAERFIQTLCREWAYAMPFRNS